MEMRAAVVGAGLIGSKLDDGPTRFPLTHAGAYLSSGCDLRALVDVNKNLSDEAAKWNVQAYRSFSEMMDEVKPELLSFAVPAEVRPDLMLEALDYKCLKAVVAEKPLAESLERAKFLVNQYEKFKIPLIVNYSRRFIKFWQDLRGIEALSVNIKYAKGIKHNGSHALDLCRMLFGECKGMSVVSGKIDYFPNDPTLTAILHFERCPEVILQGVDERHFTLFEVDIITANSRFIVDQDGQRIRISDLNLKSGTPKGKRLVETSNEIVDSNLAMSNLMFHVKDVANGMRPLCGGVEALASLSLADELTNLYFESCG
jgi:predicted dehydrogenase